MKNDPVLHERQGRFESLPVWLFRRRLLGEGLDGLGREADAFPIDHLGLQVHGERPSRGDIGMASGISGACSASGHLAYSAHSRGLEVLQGIRYHGNRIVARARLRG